MLDTAYLPYYTVLFVYYTTSVLYCTVLYCNTVTNTITREDIEDRIDIDDAKEAVPVLPSFVRLILKRGKFKNHFRAKIFSFFFF